MIYNLDMWFERHEADAVKMGDHVGHFLCETLWWRLSEEQSAYFGGGL